VMFVFDVVIVLSLLSDGRAETLPVLNYSDSEAYHSTASLNAPCNVKQC